MPPPRGAPDAEEGLERLADRFLDVWQETLLAAARDPPLALDLFRIFLFSGPKKVDIATWTDAMQRLREETQGPATGEESVASGGEDAGEQPDRT